MMIFQWLFITIMFIQIDASKHRYSRQTGTVLCADPDVPFCDYVQCENGGQCIDDKTIVDCFKCQCSVGYTGQLCESSIVTPIGCNPGCQNGGKCEQTAVNTFQCVCPEGYTGNQCETSVISTHPCATQAATLCQNGGTCTMKGANYICRCSVGWTGPNCQTKDAISSCDPNPCGAHGTCLQAILPTGPAVFCNCQDRWTGKYCDFNLDGCPAGFCLSGGTCQMTGNVANCICPPTHTGVRCETATGALTTATTATTSTTTTTITSTFTITTTTTTASSSVSRPVLVPGNCLSSPCLNGGSCFNTGNSFVCVCKQQWSGPTCNAQNPTAMTTTTTSSSINDACLRNPCANGGSCYRHADSFVCVCTSQYTGALCDTVRTTTPPVSVTNPTITCANNPCQNGARCFNTGNTYYCYCGTNSNFTGKNCETPLSAIASNCPLNCAPGYCVRAGADQNSFACMCNGILTPTSCS